MNDPFLPGLPTELIRAAYLAAPGNEFASGKFNSPESSAALVANTFGLFLDRFEDLPPLPTCEGEGSPTRPLKLEAIVRFPWRGGRHPCLDVLVETQTALIGIESKRYEPFRTRSDPTFSTAFWRPVWGNAMTGYECVRDGLHDGTMGFVHLDAAQLVKHAFGLRTAVHRKNLRNKRAILLYLYAEPRQWPDGRPISVAAIEAHRAEARQFAQTVGNDEVTFKACTYDELLTCWEHATNAAVSSHSAAIRERFAP